MAAEAVKLERPHPKGETPFTLGQDNTVTSANMLSTFKKDFPAHPLYQKVSAAVPPPLGRVMHVDDRYFNDKVSETVKSFEQFHLPKPVLMGEAARLNATNFKMDKDLNKFKVYNTTHQSNFPAQVTGHQKAKPTLSMHESHIQQGDKEKEHLPITDYRDRFPGIDTNVHRITRAARMHDVDSAPIRGDTRPKVDSYSTSNRSDFPDRSVPKVPPFPVAYMDHIPRGDPEKEMTKESTMRASYNIGLTNPQPPLSRATSGGMRRTNFRDGDERVTAYQSMAMEAFGPKRAMLERPSKIRNASFVPQGDLDPTRSMMRVSTTTNRFYQGEISGRDSNVHRRCLEP